MTLTTELKRFKKLKNTFFTRSFYLFLSIEYKIVIHYIFKSHF